MAALRIDSAHHMPDGAVSSRRMSHSLQNDQERVRAARVEFFLQPIQFRQDFLGALFPFLFYPRTNDDRKGRCASDENENRA